MEKYRNYKNPKSKIRRLSDSGDLLPLTRGVYENDKSVPGYCFAGVICGPSYLSFDYALSVHGLIPEAVYTYTSASFGKRKIKTYENYFGRFTYRDVPADAYPYGVTVREEKGYVYQIATPEKALCDKLYTMPPVKNLRETERMLFEDLRIDREIFDGLNFDDIFQIGEKYHSNNVKQLMKYIKRVKK